MKNPDQDKHEPRPWYREPWPWVIISIPGAAVIMGFITLYLALTNPAYLVVEDQTFRELKSELRAQPAAGEMPEPDLEPGHADDGEP